MKELVKLLEKLREIEKVQNPSLERGIDLTHTRRNEGGENAILELFVVSVKEPG